MLAYTGNRMKTAENQKELLITILGPMCVVPDSLFVRLITSEPMITAFWRRLTAGCVIALETISLWENLGGYIVFC